MDAVDVTIPGSNLVLPLCKFSVSFDRAGRAPPVGVPDPDGIIVELFETPVTGAG